MKTISVIASLRQQVESARQKGLTVGLVPTMGYLHEGHAALVNQARKENDLVVTSIFVNPIQFGPNEDFDSYPRDLQRDENLLTSHGCDLLFAPSVKEMYPVPPETTVQLPELSKHLCGRTRPTHFQGVTTVVSKLFHIVQPDRAYFGQKDGQQVVLIRRMVEDLNMPLRIVTVPTVREPDGLAKSSRNLYLTNLERNHATVLYRALRRGKELLGSGERDSSKVAGEMRKTIEADELAKVDYTEVVNLRDLQSPPQAQGQIMLAVAAYIGKARLIDNFQLEVTSREVQDLYPSNEPVCE